MCWQSCPYQLCSVDESLFGPATSVLICFRGSEDPPFSAHVFSVGESLPDTSFLKLL